VTRGLSARGAQRKKCHAYNANFHLAQALHIDFCRVVVQGDAYLAVTLHTVDKPVVQGECKATP
jgi:hypothetical protein